MHEKLEKFWASSIQPTFFKLGEYHLLCSILTLLFTNFVKFNFGKSYVIGFSYKLCYFWLLCLPVKMAPKTVIRQVYCISKGQKPSLFVFSGNEQVYLLHKNWIANLTDNLLNSFHCHNYPKIKWKIRKILSVFYPTYILQTWRISSSF